MADDMIYRLAAAVLVAFGAGWLATAWVRRHAGRLGLVQAPNHRSSHQVPTPTGGGLGMIAGGVLALLCLPFFAEGGLIAGLGLVLSAVGLRDDRQSLPALVRLAAQCAVCAVAVWLIRPEAPAWLVGWLWFPALVIVGVGWINLFNFMDGIDGIAAMQAIFMLAASVLISGAALTFVGAWMLALAAATAGFARHNWPPAKIFMGDAGSTFLAFVIFALGLATLQTRLLGMAAWPVLGALFIADGGVTLLRRMAARECWWQAHRSHAYQRLARRFGSHRRVTLLALAVNLGWVLPLAWAAERLSQPWFWAVCAYMPLVVLALACGAGKNDETA